MANLDAQSLLVISYKLESLNNFKDHQSVLRIQQKSEDWLDWLGNPEVKPVTQGQVLAALESLNTNKATGCDNVPSKVLKIAADRHELAKPLTILFNSCILKS